MSPSGLDSQERNSSIFSTPLQPLRSDSNNAVHFESEVIKKKEERIFWINPSDNSLNVTAFDKTLNTPITLKFEDTNGIVNSNRELKLAVQSKVEVQREPFVSFLESLLNYINIYLRDAGKAVIPTLSAVYTNEAAASIFDRKITYTATI